MQSFFPSNHFSFISFPVLAAIPIALTVAANFDEVSFFFLVDLFLEKGHQNVFLNSHLFQQSNYFLSAAVTFPRLCFHYS